MVARRSFQNYFVKGFIKYICSKCGKVIQAPAFMTIIHEKCTTKFVKYIKEEN